MSLELIPVIEVFYPNEGVVSPNGSSRELPHEWNKYNEKNLILAGFKDKFTPYIDGSWLCRINEITDSNLIRIIELYFEDFELDEPIQDDDLQPLDGGYVLRDKNKNLILPQCCGNLGDIESWEGIINPKNSYFWNGHPTPKIIQKNENIIFDLTELNQNEVSIKREDLKNALIETKKTLNSFAKRINKLENDYGITNLGGKLIFNQ